MPYFRRAALYGLLTLLLVTPSIASDVSPAARPSGNGVKWEDIQQEALDLFLQYLKIDTTNPSGNEIRAAQFFANICKREGIEHQVFEPVPGRGTIWARVRGDGAKRPLILLNHSDVVPHNKEFWSVEAFGGVIKDGFIYGRGAMDMKSLGIAQFVTLLTLKRAKVPLARDVIFLSTADEEAGGLNGAGWFAKSHPELIANAEFLFNEGGNNIVDANGKALSIGVGPSEKAPAWLRLTATGEAGHGSTPRPDSSVNRLLRALNRLIEYTPQVQLAPVVEQSFRSIAPLAPPQQAAKYANLREAIKDPDFLRQLDSDPFARSIIRNTISITVLQGSNKINVIPPAAYAEIDTRLVPGEKLDRWISELRSVIKDDTIKVEPILSFEANASPINSQLVEAVAAIAKQNFPDAIITYPVLTGFTDSHYFRDLGVMSYGFSPFVASPRELGGGYHGNDERIGKKAYVDGVKFFYEIIERLAR
jgi:acetylornithine deacetylase/succinyl-diaminopimelate desuccinylase-like protein